MNNEVEAISHEVLAARASITDLIHGYARTVRQHDFPACAAMFTSDAIFEIREAAATEPAGYRQRYLFRGPDEIRDYLEKGAIASLSVFPLIQNLIISVKGLTATSNCMMNAWLMPGGRQILGEYEDFFRWESGWRFSRRVYTIWGQSGPP
jgi:hypothetical protein